MSEQDINKGKARKREKGREKAVEKRPVFANNTKLNIEQCVN